jgi:predicted transcriptional regulator
MPEDPGPGVKIKKFLQTQTNVVVSRVMQTVKVVFDADDDGGVTVNDVERAVGCSEATARNYLVEGLRWGFLKRIELEFDRYTKHYYRCSDLGLELWLDEDAARIYRNTELPPTGDQASKVEGYTAELPDLGTVPVPTTTRGTKKHKYRRVLDVIIAAYENRHSGGASLTEAAVQLNISDYAAQPWIEKALEWEVVKDHSDDDSLKLYVTEKGMKVLKAEAGRDSRQESSAVEEAEVEQESEQKWVDSVRRVEADGIGWISLPEYDSRRGANNKYRKRVISLTVIHNFNTGAFSDSGRPHRPSYSGVARAMGMQTVTALQTLVRDDLVVNKNGEFNTTAEFQITETGREYLRQQADVVEEEEAPETDSVQTEEEAPEPEPSQVVEMRLEINRRALRDLTFAFAGRVRDMEEESFSLFAKALNAHVTDYLDDVEAIVRESLES